MKDSKNTKNPLKKDHFFIILLLLWITVLSSICIGQTNIQSKVELDKAISVLRNIKYYDKMSDKEMTVKSEQIEKAWKVIKNAGKEGTERIKNEIKNIDSKKEKDDYFKLSASAVLWEIGGVSEAETIAEIWRTTSLEVQPGYVFYTAVQAASTQDKNVLPMLKACMGNNKLGAKSSIHFIPFPWPTSVEFIWGAYGSKGIPILLNIMETSKTPIEVASSMYALVRCFDLSILPKIRQLAKSEEQEIRCMALKCLGIYGHPQDFDLLISGLKSNNAEEVFSCAYALYEFEDLRAVPFLIPLIQSKDEKVRGEVIQELCHLITPASLETIHNYAVEKSKERKGKKDYETLMKEADFSKPETIKAVEEARNNPIEMEIHQCKETSDYILRELGLTWDEYAKKNPKEKDKLISDFWKKNDEKYNLSQKKEKISYDEAVNIINDVKKNGSISKEFKSKDIISVVTLKDMDLLIDARASFYKRLSDECMYDIGDISKIMKHLARSTYRNKVGIAEKVEAK